MDGLILRCLPARVRARYGEEIRELLVASRRPVRDRGDLLVAALGLRLGRLLPWCLLLATAALAVATTAVAYSVTNLSAGVSQVTHHWWSTFAAIGLASALGAVALLIAARRQARSWGDRRSPT